MKIKRLKRANRILTFFRYNYDYLPPYSTLLDGTFCQAALKNQINLREQFPKYLSNDVNIFVTKCVINELEKLGTQVYGALAIARQFELAKCPHKPMRTAAECLKHLARRSKIPKHEKYFIGTQDDNLLKDIREVGGVPLMSIRYNTILLEKPSPLSIEGAETTNSELEKVKQLKKEVLGVDDDSKMNKRKRKAPKAPNPLSCKKKKKAKIFVVQPTSTAAKSINDENPQITTTTMEKKKRRKRIKKRKIIPVSAVEKNVIEI